MCGQVSSMARYSPLTQNRATSLSPTETVLPSSEEDKKTVTVKQSSSWTDLVSRNASSVSEIVLALTFIPFLVFFMLSWKDHVRSATVMLFRMENRNNVYVMLGLIALGLVMLTSTFQRDWLAQIFVSALVARLASERTAPAQGAE